MQGEIIESEYKYSTISHDENVIYLESKKDNLDKIAIKLTIALRGNRRGEERRVNTNLPLDNYLYARFINPYLTAQSDLFKLKYKAKTGDMTIGYIFPNSSLEDDIADVEEDFDEAKQAYKFYTIRKIIDEYSWGRDHEGKEISVSHFTDSQYSHLIIFKPLVKDIDLNVEGLLPSLALYGYYHFSSKATPNILSVIEAPSKNQEVADVVQNYFAFRRGQESLSVRSSDVMMNKIPLIKLVYQQLLVEADNPLYRFLILYQIIEYLVDKSFRENLEKLINERDSFNSYDFVTKINEVKKTRTIINSLFGRISFEGKEDITLVLKNFLLEFDELYSLSSTGDCLYDIRNLFFHDYKNVLEFKKTDKVTSLIILCEILIHRLVNQYASSLDDELKNSTENMPFAWLYYKALQE